MSNPQTYYTVGGIDLSSIFQPLSLGSPYPYLTGYTVNGTDLNSIFAAYTSGQKAITTGYQVLGNDLNNIFEKHTPPTYVINTSNNLTFTEYNNNGYTGLVFEVNDRSNNATASIIFYKNINVSVLCVGGGGGGDFSSQGGGGGGGITYLTNYYMQSNNICSLQVGKGGSGSTIFYDPTNGSDTFFNDNTTNYIGTGGSSPVNNPFNNPSIIGGNGGNSSAIDGGGGGGGGSFSSAYIVGTGGTNNVGGNMGYPGSYPPANTTGGDGGQSYYVNISIPFLQINPSLITVGGGGGAGGLNLGGTSYGGAAGSGYGGNGSSSGGSGNTNGSSATNSINSGYGGGGGGAGNGSNSPISGSGGNGVVIIWYPTNPIMIQRVSDLSFNSNVGYATQFTSNNTNQYIYASCLGYNYSNPPDLYTTILMSSDYGVSWSRLYPDGNTTNTNFGWVDIASNSTGSIVIACNSDTQTIWKSTDYGSTWVNLNVPKYDWSLLCIDSNINIYAIAPYVNLVGTVLYKFDSSGNIIQKSYAINSRINSITCSDSGQYIYYVNNGYGAYYSSNNGYYFSVSYIDGTLGTQWAGNVASVTCSSDGEYVYACGATDSNAFILFSDDYGANFTTIFTTQNIVFYSICCDSTGNIVTAGGPTTNGTIGSIYTTSNGLLGVNSTWNLIQGSDATNFTYWFAVTCDRNTGNKITMLSAQTDSNYYLGGIWSYN